jgi:hypothetical protein
MVIHVEELNGRIATLQGSVKSMEDERDAEITHLKRQAENTIRHLKTFEAEKTPSRYYV